MKFVIVLYFFWISFVIGSVKADITCLDETSTCPDDFTCCEMAGGKYGCCPMPNAVCCSDKVHCCPESTTCDLQQQKCEHSTLGSSVSRPWSHIVARKPTEIICNATSQESCPDDKTCCQLQSGQYGCCIYPKAVCCEDKEHCCPQNTKCDVQQQRCVETTSGLTIPWSRKISARKNVKANDVQCDPSTTCPDGSTCCQLASGGWGCCPMPNAVCCEDHVHCCPEGTTCDVKEGSCQQRSSGMAIPWFKKISSTKKMQERKPGPLFPTTRDLVCPDKVSVCLGDDATCCKMLDGKYGCCPFSNAVCCPNRRFCCPANTSCSLHRDQCFSQSNEIVNSKPIYSPRDLTGQLPSMPLFRMATGRQVYAEARLQQCNGGSDQCLDDTTCCQTNSGFGCCPHPNGQCCADRKHCCPMGSTCDSATSKCTTINGNKFDWTAIISKSVPQQSQCPGNGRSCSNGGKCCINIFGVYSCCPDPEGVCCSNGQFCCPKGYICQITGSCLAVIE